MTTMVLKFAVHPEKCTVDDANKFIVRLEVPVRAMPSESAEYAKWINAVSDSVRAMFDPKGVCVYLMTEPEADDQSKIAMRFSFEQLRSDLVDSNIRLSNIERAANDVVGAWEGGEDLAAAVCALRRKLLERL